MTVLSSVPSDYAQMYDGYDSQLVGLGVDTANYASPQYAKLKTDKLLIGGLSEVIYAGMEHDRMPRIIPMAFETQYNTILAYNINYIPIDIRKRMIKQILQSNVARIQSNQPMFVDYYDLKAVVPETRAIVRRYKILGLRVLDAIPLRDWDRAIAVRTGWENHYRRFLL